MALEALHRDGADPAQVIADLAEAVHTRHPRQGRRRRRPAGEALSAEERRRATALAGQLSMPLLSRAWQMLLKGIEEVARAPDPLAAAEMVLIRLAHTADLPSPDEIIKAIGGGTVSRRAATGASAPSASDQRDPPSNGRQSLNAAPPAGGASDGMSATPPPAPHVTRAPIDELESEPPTYLDDPDDPGPGQDDDEATPARPAPPALRPIRTFADVVALVGDRRDIKLKVHLEEHVSLVKLDLRQDGVGQLELFLLPGAPRELPNELREKLNAWTGKRWMVAVARVPGERAIGDVRREREQKEMEELRRHPAVAAVLAGFPGAEIKAVRPLHRPPPATQPDSNDEPGSAAG